MREAKTLGLLAVLGAVALWSPSYVATKVVLEEMRPYLLAFVRFVLGTGLLLPVALAAWRGARPGVRLPLGRLALMGLTGGALYFGLQNAGMLFVTALEASVVSAVLPAVVALVSWMTIGETLRPVQAAGIALAVLGVVLLVLAQGAAESATLNPWGYLLLLGAAVSWAFFTVLGRKLDPALPSAVVSAFNVGFGALFLLPAALADVAEAGWPALSPLDWGLLVMLGLGGSGLSFLLWNWGLRSVPAGEATTLTNVTPFLGAFLAWAILREPLTWGHLGGALVVLAGISLVTRTAQSAHRPSDRRAGRSLPVR